MILMGNGHLIANGIKLADSKKFIHLCTTLMEKVEQRHGPKLKPMVSNWFLEIRIYFKKCIIFAPCFTTHAIWICLLLCIFLVLSVALLDSALRLEQKSAITNMGTNDLHDYPKG